MNVIPEHECNEIIWSAQKSDSSYLKSWDMNAVKEGEIMRPQKAKEKKDGETETKLTEGMPE